MKSNNINKEQTLLMKSNSKTIGVNPPNEIQQQNQGVNPAKEIQQHNEGANTPNEITTT